MAQTLCIKCGSELKASSFCQLCQQPLIFACTSCEYASEEKVHPDCRNAEVLAKTTTTPTFISTTTANQQENIVDKIKQEKIPKVEISSVPSSMKSEQDNDKDNNNNNNNNVNPFSASTAAWQSLMTYWLQMCGVSFKNTLKMTEEWYNIFYKLWVN
jgi:hypothetical protein